MSTSVLAKNQRTIAGVREQTSTVSWILFATGIVFLVGTLVDLGLLWIGQRQPGLQWEFVAVTNTVEGWPRLILAAALLYLGRHLGGVHANWLRISLALLVLVLGLGAVVLGGMAALNYLSLAKDLNPDSGRLFSGAALKTGILCGTYVFLLIPLGVMGLRRPKA